MAKDRPTHGVNPTLRENYTGYYADGASEWRRICAVDKVRNIQALCADLPFKTVIEIGAGEGSVTQRMSELGVGEAYVALEISQTGLETLKNRQVPGLVDCQLFDGYAIPYDDKSFDLAILSHVLEHVEHPRRLLYELRGSPDTCSSRCRWRRPIGNRKTSCWTRLGTSTFTRRRPSGSCSNLLDIVY